MESALIEVVIALIVIGAIAAIIRIVPIPEWIRQAGYIVVGVVALIVIIRFLWGIAAGGPIVIAP